MGLFANRTRPISAITAVYTFGKKNSTHSRVTSCRTMPAVASTVSCAWMAPMVSIVAATRMDVRMDEVGDDRLLSMVIKIKSQCALVSPSACLATSVPINCKRHVRKL